ncbi:MAG TPA: diguanylate cyclase [Candidatus Tectomicrobia bacterium]|nr:diguanylate cyclase [Candidatus Tectomicrobia bacterium]
MPGQAPDVAEAAQRLRNKILAAVALSTVLPLLALAYVVVALTMPTPGLGGLRALVVFAGLGMLVGAYFLWDMGRAVGRIGGLVRSDGGPRTLEPRGDEIGTLMAAFARMIETVERQAAEINRFAERLDAAYKELEATNARLKETSFKDEVTGLYNRRFFSLRLEEEMSRYRRFSHPVSVVLLDLDGFKSVNDEFGHTVGDQTLRDVAQILMKHSRGINVVSRYGGDEFAVLLVETSKAGARLYADRIREVLAKFSFSHGKVLTASFGVASLPDDEAPTAEELFRAADVALYAAKRAGKNRVAVALAPQGVP